MPSVKFRDIDEEKRIIKIYRDNILCEIKKRKISQAELAARLMLNKNYFNIMYNPSLANMVRVAGAIGCKFKDLMKGI